MQTNVKVIAAKCTIKWIPLKDECCSNLYNYQRFLEKTWYCPYVALGTSEKKKKHTYTYAYTYYKPTPIPRPRPRPRLIPRQTHTDGLKDGLMDKWMDG